LLQNTLQLLIFEKEVADNLRRTSAFEEALAILCILKQFREIYSGGCGREEAERERARVEAQGEMKSEGDRKVREIETEAIEIGTEVIETETEKEIEVIVTELIEKGTEVTEVENEGKVVEEKIKEKDIPRNLILVSLGNHFLQAKMSIMNERRSCSWIWQRSSQTHNTDSIDICCRIVQLHQDFVR